MYVLVHWSVLSFVFFKQKTAYEMRISDWSSDVCSSDLRGGGWSWLVSASACVIAVRHYAETPTRLIPFSVAPVTSSTVRVSRSGGQSSRQRSAIKIGRASCRERVCQYV